MDLWDLTKVLFRRWYIALPVLLASLAVVMYMASTVKPDYVAKGYLQLIPPSGAAQTNPANPHPRNPWIDLGLGSLANAAVVKVVDPAVLVHLVEEGYADSVVVTMPTQSPLLYIEAVGSTPQQATLTVRQIIKELNKDVVAEQARYGVLAEDTITTLTLNDGATPEEKTSKVKRVVAVSAGIGLLITTVGTILVDNLLRRRSRRRSPGPDRRLALPPSGSPPYSDKQGVSLLEPGYGTRPLGGGSLAPVSVTVPVGAQRSGVQATSATVEPVGAAEREEGRLLAVQADTTIVLPLSHVNSRDRRDRRS